MATADFYNKTWSKKTSTLAIEESQRYQRLFGTFWDFTPQVKEGNQAGIWIPNFTPATVDTLANKTTAYLSDQSAIDIDVDADYLVFDQTLSAAFNVADLAELESNVNKRDELLKRAVSSLYSERDKNVIRALTLGIDSSHRIEIADGDAKTILTYNDIMEAYTTLLAENIPVDAPKYFVVCPQHYGDLLKMDQFTRVDYAGKTPLVSGVVGTFLDMTVIMHQNPKVDLNGVYSEAQTLNVSYIYSSFAMAVGAHRDIHVKVEDKALPAKAVVNPYTKFGRKIIQDKFAVAIRDQT